MSALRRVRASARHVPGVPRARRELWLQRSSRTISTSGLFDASWYRLQTGRDDLDDDAALEDYLRTGRRRGFSPAPFFEPATFDSSWRKRVEDPFALFLRHAARRRDHRWHSGVLFDGDLTTGPDGRLRPPSADEPVTVCLDREPDPARTPVLRTTWGVVREHLLRRTALWREQEDARTYPTRVQRPPSQERSFRRAVAGRALPATAPGEPLVTVVMPTWNRQAVVGTAVASVQAQTLAGWELVVADDGSVDDTVRVVEGIAHFDDRVRLLRLGRSGVGPARNAAVAAARGRYVAFLDSDNTWEPDFLELMVKGMETLGSHAAFASVEMVAPDRHDYRVGSGRREHLLVANHVDLNALVARTDVVRQVGAFSEDLRRTVDYDLALKLSALRDLDFLPFVGVVYTDDGEEGAGADRISVREPLTWDFVTRSRHMVDWATLDAAPRVPGLLSVVTTTGAPRWGTTAAVAAVLRQEGAPSLQVVLVDRGGSRADSAALSLLELADGRVEVVRTAADTGVPLALDVGLGHARGEHVALLPPGLVLEPAAVRPLVAAVDAGAPAAQPLVVDARDLVSGAGMVVPRRGTCVPFLPEHPVDDVPDDRDLLPVPALLGGGLVARTDAVVAARGLDPLLAGPLVVADLSLRLRAAASALPVVVTSARAQDVSKDWGGRLAQTDRRELDSRHQALPADLSPYEGARVELVSVHTHRAPDGTAVRPEPRHTRRSTTAVADGPAAGLPGLRWALVTAAPAGPRGRGWGDLHFAEALARSLRRLGQDAHVYAREAEARGSAHLDDVRLVLRGLDPVRADPGRTTLTWVISHPDAVGDDEVRRSDLVFAAGRTWAAEAAERTGREVRFLPQCTDPSRFRPGPAPSTGTPGRLFVGNSRRVQRPSVATLVGAGVPLSVYGGGWEDLVPEHVVAGQYLPNDLLGQAYWDAGMVLNDHWADMRRQGFIANRVIDAVAAGGRVVSDHVDGLEELLGDAVRTWRTPQELLDLVTAPPGDVFGTEADRREAARRVAAEHSFDARALVLLRAAADLRA